MQGPKYARKLSGAIASSKVFTQPSSALGESSLHTNHDFALGFFFLHPDVYVAECVSFPSNDVIASSYYI